MDRQEFGSARLKPSVVVTGTAKLGAVGPAMGLVDIGVSQSAYLFQISLPGVLKGHCKVGCEIQKDGKVSIQGVILEGGELQKNSSSVFRMTVQQLCPPGPFSVTFNLPGPVDPRLSYHHFRSDGILEVTVMKAKC